MVCVRARASKDNVEKWNTLPPRQEVGTRHARIINYIFDHNIQESVRRNGSPQGNLVKKLNTPPYHHRTIISTSSFCASCAKSLYFLFLSSLLFSRAHRSFFPLVWHLHRLISPRNAHANVILSHYLCLVFCASPTCSRTWLCRAGNHRWNGMQRKCAKRRTNPVHRSPDKYHRPRKGCFKSIPELRSGCTESLPRCRRESRKSIAISLVGWRRHQREFFHIFLGE